MDRRTKICIWVIMLGLANFLAYVLLYTYIWGEAVNGHVQIDQAGQLSYYLHTGQRVSRLVFIYSGVHSISIWPTVAAVMLAMLTLAKERIISSMRRTILRGRTFITALAVIITLMTILFTIRFTSEFVDRLNSPVPAADTSAHGQAHHP